MTYTITPRRDILVLELHGRMDSQSAGQTYDTLVNLARSGQQNLIVDLSGVACITRAGVRGLIVAARMLMAQGGAMRICGAGLRATELLNGLGYRHLLKLDCTRALSLAILSPSDGMATSIAEILTAPACPVTVVEGHFEAGQQMSEGSDRRAVSR